MSAIEPLPDPPLGEGDRAPSPPEPGSRPDPARRAQELLLDQLGWLIRLRWIAVAGVGLVVGAANLLGVLPAPAPHLVIAAGLAVANLVFWARRRRGPRSAEREATAQILVDLAALTALLHWSDGIENPFSMFFAFHAAIAAMLLPARRAFALAGVATIVQCGTVVAEYLGVLEHHPLLGGTSGRAVDPVIASGSSLAIYLIAFSITMFCTVYFMASMAQRQRQADDERLRLEHLAASRERLAAIGEISAGVAHALRNPVHGLLNCLELLAPHVPDEPDCSATLSLMDEGLRRISGLSHRLLTYARHPPLRLTRVDLRQLVQRALRLMGGLDAGQGPGVSLPAGPPVPALVDQDQVTEALGCVVENALAACRAGGAVEVSVQAEPAPPGGARIVVHDSGEGIAPENIERAFEAFFTTRNAEDGTGLGLAITRRILQSHGGRVELESQVGVGTTVRLLFPAGPVARNLLEERG